MPSSPLDRRILVTATVLALAAVAVTLWCVRPRPVEVAAAPASGSAACRAVAARWPDQVAAVQRRDDVQGAPAAAAWGDPAIIARCGLAPVAPTTDQCVSAAGVDWVVHPLSDGTRLTTYGTDPALEVLVPRTYDPAPLRVAAFADAAKALPRTGRACR